MNVDDQISHYKNLLAQLGETISLPDLAPDETNRCRLVFDDALEVTLDAVPDDALIWIHAHAGAAPVREASAFYRDLLAAALFGQGTQGASVALDEISNSIILMRQLPIQNLTYDTFETALTDFVNGLEIWQNRLANLSSSSTTLPRSPDAGAPHAVRA